MSGETQAGGSTAIPTVEARDASSGRIALLLAGLVGGLLLVCACVAGMLLLFGRAAPPSAAPPPAALIPPEPRLQADEAIQRHRIEAATRPDPAALDAAMRRLVRAGWPRGTTVPHDAGRRPGASARVAADFAGQGRGAMAAPAARHPAANGIGR